MPMIGGKMVNFGKLRYQAYKKAQQAKEAVNRSKIEENEKKQINDAISDIEKFLKDIEEMESLVVPDGVFDEDL